MATRTLSWDVSEDTTVTGYAIQYAEDVDGTTPQDESFTDLDETSGRETVTYEHDDGGTTYWYRVAAENPVGFGPWSLPFRAWTIPSAYVCVVSGTLVGADGVPVADGYVNIKTGKGAVRIDGQPYQIGQHNAGSIRTNANGQWTANIVRSAALDPAGTPYIFEFKNERGQAVWDAEKRIVPDQASATYNDLAAPE